METRIGFGYDSHVFKPGVTLRVGGLTLDHPEGLAGHSDGDVLLHAITDALLGAVAAGDIGSFFPPGDPRWKDADSAICLNLDHVAQCHAVALVERVAESDDLKSMSAVIESQRQLEDVVEDLVSSVHGVRKKRIAPVYDTEDIT